MKGDFFKHNTDIGQNFLRDRSVAEWMANRAKLTPEDRVLEIGPGSGVLTEAILAADCASLDAVELDKRLAPQLDAIAARDNRLRIHWGDAVVFDYSAIEPPTKILANLPYHITTPLIWKLLESFSRHGSPTRYMLFMVQREAAERIASGAGVRASNPLGITIAALGSAAVARKVSRGAFTPMPRVDSSIVEIALGGENANLPNDPGWRRLLAGSFSNRRKTLANNWGASFGMEKTAAEEILAAHALGRLARPEEIHLQTWLRLHGAPALTHYFFRLTR